MINHELKKLGLSSYEADIYALLLKHSPAGVSFIAKELSLSRSSVYTAIERLIKKGLVSTSQITGVRQFIAEGEEALQKIIEEERKKIEEKEEIFQSLKAYVKTLHHSNLTLPDITIHDGASGVERICWNMLRNAPQDGAWHVLRGGFDLDSNWMFFTGDQWQRLRKEKNVSSKILIPKGSLESKQVAEYKLLHQMELKFLAESLELEDFSLQVLGDTVALISLEKGHPIGVQVSNPLIARNISLLLSYMWSL